MRGGGGVLGVVELTTFPDFLKLLTSSPQSCSNPPGNINSPQREWKERGVEILHPIEIKIKQRQVQSLKLKDKDKYI